MKKLYFRFSPFVVAVVCRVPAITLAQTELNTFGLAPQRQARDYRAAASGFRKKMEESRNAGDDKKLTDYEERAQDYERMADLYARLEGDAGAVGEKININDAPLRLYFFYDDRMQRPEGLIVAGHANEIVCSAISALVMYRLASINLPLDASNGEMPFATAGFGMFFVPGRLRATGPGLQASKVLAELMNKAWQVAMNYPQALHIYRFKTSVYEKARYDLIARVKALPKSESGVVNLAHGYGAFPVVLPYIEGAGQELTVEIPAADLAGLKLTIGQLGDLRAQADHQKKWLERTLDSSWDSNSPDVKVADDSRSYKARLGSIKRLVEMHRSLLCRGIGQPCSIKDYFGPLLEETDKEKKHITGPQSALEDYLQYAQYFNIMNAFECKTGERIEFDLFQAVEELKKANSGDAAAKERARRKIEQMQKDYKNLAGCVATARPRQGLYDHMAATSTYDSFLRGWYLSYGSPDDNVAFDKAMHERRGGVVQKIAGAFGIEVQKKPSLEKEEIKVTSDDVKAHWIRVALHKISSLRSSPALESDVARSFKAAGLGYAGNPNSLAPIDAEAMKESVGTLRDVELGAKETACRDLKSKQEMTAAIQQSMEQAKHDEVRQLVTEMMSIGERMSDCMRAWDYHVNGIKEYSHLAEISSAQIVFPFAQTKDSLIVRPHAVISGVTIARYDVAKGRVFYEN